MASLAHQLETPAKRKNVTEMQLGVNPECSPALEMKFSILNNGI
jgi:hypothetical protein